MTDRHAGYLVTLDQDIREDDAEESVLVALRMIKGVVSVVPVPDDPQEYITRARLGREWTAELVKVIGRMTGGSQ